MARTSTALVLGAGGARGLAHIGAIRCLEERGYDVRYIAGSSMGAVVGGIYAAGKLDVFAEWASALERLDVLRLLDWSLGRGALFKGERIIRVLRDLIGDCDIEDLPIGFTAVATELATSREMWLQSGSLFDAIRASISVPTVFQPVRREGYLLVDGGIVNPVPVAPTLNAHCETTIVVDLNAPDEPDAPVVNRAQSVTASTPAERQSLLRILEALLPTGDTQPNSTELGFYDLGARSIDAMQRTLTRLRLAPYDPTAVVRIPGNLCGLFDFHHAKRLIEYGYERTADTLAQLER